MAKRYTRGTGVSTCLDVGPRVPQGGVNTDLGESRGTIAVTPQGVIIFPLLANIALSALGEAIGSSATQTTSSS